jgi:hypothetical protein|tara:strand:- start:798 stop:1082 length:285 start_codon:yes stop_codon:yes gene_type:complete
MAQAINVLMVWQSTEAGAGQDSMKSIDEHIQKDHSEIQAAKDQGDDAKVRHLTDELNSLEEYKEHHPGDKHDPNALELFCDANPDEPECRVYDD